MKLTAEQRAARTKAIDAMDAAHAELVDAIAEYNAATSAARAALEVAAETYNTALHEATGALQDIGSEISEAIGEKSEHWQESDTGCAAAEWASNYETFTPDEFDPMSCIDTDDIEPPAEFSETVDDAGATEECE